MQLLINEIEDERRMFGNTALTRAERERMQFQEKILAIATEIKRSHEATTEETYVMPQSYEKDSKGMTERQKLLKARYRCACGNVDLRSNLIRFASSPGTVQQHEPAVAQRWCSARNS